MRIVPTSNNIHLFTVEFLILNEEDIDWEQLSDFKDRRFSLPEIRMFRKKINWNLYVPNHVMNENEIDIASKYFSEELIYKLPSMQELTEKIVRKFRNKIHWSLLLLKSKFPESFLLEMSSSWKDIGDEKLQTIFTSNRAMDIFDGNYESLLLYLNLKD